MRKNTVKVNFVRDLHGNKHWDLTVTPELFQDWMDDKLLYSIDGPYSAVGHFSDYFVDANPLCHLFADKKKVLESGEFIDLGNGHYESIEEAYKGHKLELWTNKACALYIKSHLLPRSGNYRMRVCIFNERN